MLQTQEILDDFPVIQMVRTSRFISAIARLAMLTCVAALIGLVFLPWQQTASGIGRVVAVDPQNRPQPVLSPAKGVVGHVKAGLREGSFVEKDDLLIRLIPFAEEGITQLETQIIALESKETAALNSLEIAKQAATLQESSGKSLAASLNQDYEAAKNKWEQAKNEVTSLQAVLEDKRNQLRIAQEVAEQGLVSKEEVFSKQQAVESQFAKVLKAENAVEEAYAALLSKEEEIQSKLQDIDIKNRAANQKVLEEMQKINTIEKELLDLQSKRGEFDRLEIRAPRTGYIQNWFGLEGSDIVKEGDQLFVIVPQTDDLGVELQVSGNDMPLISEGDRVRLQFEGWPAVQFVGWPSVAVGTFGGKVNRVFPTDDGKGNFRLLVTPENHFPHEEGWPDNRYLRQGVRVNGWVLLKKVPLGYELWRQLNGFPPAVESKPPGGSKEKGTPVKVPKA